MDEDEAHEFMIREADPPCQFEAEWTCGTGRVRTETIPVALPWCATFACSFDGTSPRARRNPGRWIDHDRML